MSNKKILIVSLICLIIFFILPLSFAEDIDNQTITTVDDDNEIQSGDQTDYYFNASSNSNGNGSADNPYKKINQGMIGDDSNIHLAEGEYDFNPKFTITNLARVNIIGAGPTKTVLYSKNYAIQASDFLTLTNLTLRNITIMNNGTINATNVIFENCHAWETNNYGTSYGCAIYTKDSNADACVTIENCTFENNYATYGGAIYMGAGSLSVSNSQFINNTAFHFGGAIACENCREVTISKSKFIKNTCIYDAGAIYIKSVEVFKAENLDIFNSTAAFGSAITTLNCTAFIYNLNAYDNTAFYEGGALFHMYGAYTLISSNFINNSARNGGVLFIDNSSAFNLMFNNFSDNVASGYAGAIYLMYTHSDDYYKLNYFTNNRATDFDDVCDVWTIDFNMVSGLHDIFKLTETTVTEFPSNYSLYDDNYLTPVKHQFDGGNCWAFTAVAVLESCIKKISGIDYDFSEENIKNLMTLYSDYGWATDANNGGHEDMAFGYFSSWLGPVNDIDDLYSPISVLSVIYNSMVHVQNILFIKRENSTDNDAVKDAILKYGAVGTAMLYYDYFLNNDVNYYCSMETYGQTNHAVTIVGWDDNYSRYNFYDPYNNEIPEADGAWIIRNSWGPEWGNDGYFYVSYYDKTLGYSDDRNTLYTFVLNETEKYDKNYQHEVVGVTGHSSYSSQKIWYKNVYESEDYEILKAVSTYFDDFTNWTVTINVNGVTVTSKSGSSVPGYWTISLDDVVKLLPGDEFEVVFNITCEDVALAPTSGLPSANKYNNISGISFISSSGQRWFDLSERASPSVACIKAFTIIDDYNTTTYLTVSYDQYNPVNITATVLDVYQNFAQGNVTFYLDGKKIVLNLTNGVASFTYNFIDEFNEISCVFEGDGYVSSKDSTSIMISKKDVKLNLNVTRNVNNLIINVTASENINASISLFVNNDNYQLNLTNGGVCYTVNNQSNGKYFIRAVLEKNYFWKADDVSADIKINVKDTSILSSKLITSDFSNEIYYVILLDCDHNLLDGKTVIFKLDDKYYPVVTDMGKACLPINLSRGNYEIEMFFEGDNDYWASGSVNNITVKTNVEAQITIDKQWYDANVTVTFTKPITANITASVNNNPLHHRLNDESEFVIKCTNLYNNRDYLIVVAIDDELYNFTEVIEILTIKVIRTQISADEFVTSDFSQDNYTVFLTDENNNPLDNKTVIFKLNGNSYPVVTDMGKACLPINLAYGEYEIEVMFEGDDDYYFSSNTSDILVKTDVGADISIEKYWNDANVTVVFTKPITGEMILTVNNNVTTHALNNQNRIMIPLTGLDNGKYDVSVALADEWYNFTGATSNFKINVMGTKIIAGELVTTEYSQDNYTVFLTDENNNPLDNKTVIFKLNNVPYPVVTDMGKASIPVSLAYGEYGIEIAFEGDEDYYVSSASGYILVKTDAGAEIYISQSLRTANVTVVFTKLITGNMAFSVNGEPYDISLSNKMEYRFLLTGLANGRYDISVELTDPWFDFTEATSNFTIDIIGTQIVAYDVTTDEFSGVSYKITLLDENGNPLSKQIKVVLNKETQFLSTDENGTATISISLKADRYPIIISYSNSTDKYDDCEVTHQIVVKAKDPVVPKKEDPVPPVSPSQPAPSVTPSTPAPKVTLKAANMKVKKGKAFKYSAKLLENGKPLKGKKITFKIKGKTYKAKTNKKGIATVKIKKLKAGKYKMVVKYGKITATSKITVK